MPSEPDKPVPRRPGLHGLDTKSLLIAGLMGEEPPPKTPPEKSSGLPLRLILVTGLIIAGLVVAAIALNRKKISYQDWTDLINVTAPASTLHRGDWQKTSDALESVNEAQAAMLALPVKELGASYDIQLQFTRLSGTQSVALFFRTAQGMGALEFDAWEHPGLSGVQMFDGQDLRHHGSFSFPLTNGVPYDFQLQVRPDRIDVLHHAKLLQSYPLTGRRVEITPPWDWSGEWTNAHVAVGSWRSPTRFTKLMVKRTVSD